MSEEHASWSQVVVVSLCLFCTLKSSVLLAKLLCTIKLTYNASSLMILAITRHANMLLIFKTFILHFRVHQFTRKYSPIQSERQAYRHPLSIRLPAKYKL